LIFAFTLSGLRPIGGLRPGGTKGQNRNPFGRIKDIGGGIFEYKIDFGPGYRIYFGKDGEHIVIILGGGTKSANNRI